MISRHFNRYATGNVPITAAGVLVLGFIFLLSPSTAFVSPGFRYVFNGLPQQWWGVLFIVAGVLALVFVDWLAVFALMAVVLAYAAWWCAAWTAGLASPSGWVWLMIVALQLVIAVSRRGIRG